MAAEARILARATAAETLRAIGILGRAERARRESLTVLCYHRVLPEAAKHAYHDPDLVVTPEALAAHCRLLAEKFEVAPLGEAFARWKAGGAGAKPLAAITFDDGYRDNARYAAPVLERFGLRATFFIIAGLVDTARQPWYDEAGAAWPRLSGAQCGKLPGPGGGASAKEAIAWAKGQPPEARRQWLERLNVEAGAAAPEDDALIMSAAQIRELARLGHEIGSHSMHHPILTQCSSEELRGELVDSKARLEGITGARVDAFCYPNGDYSPPVAAAVREAGYACAAAMDPGLNTRGADSPYALRRWFIHEERLRGVTAPASRTLLRMELCGLAQRVFRRGVLEPPAT